MKITLFWGGAVLLLSAFHFRGLDWGTPSPRKSELIFGSLNAIAPRTGELLASREALYEGYEEGLAGKPAYEGRAWINKSLAELLSPWQVIPHPMVLNSLRGYLLGVPSDDQQTLSALSRFKPWKGKWDPQNYTYGGLYLVSVGLFLAGGALTSYLPQSLDLTALLLNPDAVSRIYSCARAFSGLSLAVGAFLLFKLAQKDLLLWGAVAASFFALASPLSVVQSHLAKPHALSTALTLAALGCFRNRLGDAPPARSLLKAGICLGFATASSITSFFSWIAFPIAAVLFRGKTLHPILRSEWVKALGAAILSAIVFNPFVFIRPDRFLRKFLYHHVQVYGQGQINLPESFEFFRHFFVHAVPWLLLPGVMWAVWILCKNHNPFGLLISSMVGVNLIGNGLLLRHAGIGLVIVPLAGWLFAYGATDLWKRWKGRPAVHVWVGGMAFVAFTGMIGEDLGLLKRFVRAGNLTEAGTWINSQLPRGARIGILGGNINPAVVPPFRMLEFSLVVVPHDPKDWAPSKLPPYMIYTALEPSSAALDALQGEYRVLYPKSLPAGQAGLQPPGQFAPHPYLMTHENVQVTVWERKSPG